MSSTNVSYSSDDEERHHLVMPGGIDSALPGYNKWLAFDDKEHQLKYMQFQVDRTSPSIVSIFTLVCAVSVGTNLASGIADETSNTATIIRLFRFAVISLGMLYLFIDHKRRNNIQPIVRDPVTVPFYRRISLCKLSDHMILWFAVTGGLVLLQRCLVGECEKGQDLSLCNPRHEQHGLPTDTLIINFVYLICFPVTMKAHRSSYVLLSYAVTLAFFFASAVVSNAYNDVVLLIAVLIIIAVVLYDYEKSMISLYVSQRDAQIFYKQALAAVKSKKESDIENDSLCALIGNVAHDLKTPLQSFMFEINNLEASINAIFGDKNILAAELPFKKQRKDVGSTLESLKNIYSFMMLAINRGIDFRKAMAGITLQPRNETFLTSEAVEWALNRFDASPTGTVIRLIPPPPSIQLCPMIISDKHWFSENILSLVSNAVKFTMEGSVDVEYRLAERTERGKQLTSVVVYDANVSDLFSHVNPDVRRGGDDLFIVLLVQDTGVGISLDMMSTLFQPFRQAQRRAGGTGLGLFSISKRMDAIKGYCGVQGREDRGMGSCFWLAYPYVPDWDSEKMRVKRELTRSSKTAAISIENADTASVTAPAAMADKMRTAIANMSLTHREQLQMPYPLDDAFWRRVLVVDDSMLILKAVSRMLVKEGFEVDVAQNGQVGLQKMSSQQYVLVLSDIQMPVMDGNEMTRRFRELELKRAASADATDTEPSFKRRQLVVGMSANSDIDTENEALTSGMDRFVPKPVSKSSLHSCLFSEYIITTPSGEDEADIRPPAETLVVQ